MKSFRGYLYYIFPVELDDVTEEVKAVDDAWQWKYFEWVFWFLRELMSFICELKDIEPLYVIWIPKKYRKM